MEDARFKLPKAEDHYLPNEQELKFLQKTYLDLVNDLNAKSSSYKLLNDRSLQQYWDDCNDDYNVYIPAGRSDDWMKMYRRPLSRDKANAFISQLVQSSLSPIVKAQNKQQEIDRTISRVGKGMLEWAEANDGKPSSSGIRKSVDAIQKMVVEGTVHIQEDWDTEEERANKEVVPNEEICVSNFFQADLQKQPHLIRLQDRVLYEEAEAQFGELENWKYVVPGNISQWQLGETPFFKEINISTLQNNQVHILRVWRPVPKSKLMKGRKREKYFNIIINGVLMLDVDSRSPYRHGYYPIYKEVFELFDTSFYWGNSLVNKARPDQKIYDSFYTMIMNKEKLHVDPPMVSLNGFHVDQDVVRPGKITPVDQDPDTSLKRLSGVGEAIGQGEFAVLNLLERSIDTSTAAPIMAGQSGGDRKTAREVVLQEANAQKLLGFFGTMVKNLIEQGGYLRLRNLFQFVPRQKIKKIVIPEQTLQNGRTGNLEVLFQKIDAKNEEDLLNISTDLLKEEETNLAAGSPKEKIYIDPEYLDTLDLFIEVDAEEMFKPNTQTEKAMQLEKFKVYQSSPIFNQEENARALIRAFEDDEEAMIQKIPVAPQGETGTPPATPFSSRLALSGAAPGQTTLANLGAV